MMKRWEIEKLWFVDAQQIEIGALPAVAGPTGGSRQCVLIWLMSLQSGVMLSHSTQSVCVSSERSVCLNQNYILVFTSPMKTMQWRDWIILVLPVFLESLCLCITQIRSAVRNLTLKWRKWLPCFASIIQQPDFPLGNPVSSEPFKWIKKPGPVSHSCLLWNHFWESSTHPKPHFPLLQMMYGPAAPATRCH